MVVGFFTFFLDYVACFGIDADSRSGNRLTNIFPSNAYVERIGEFDGLLPACVCART